MRRGRGLFLIAACALVVTCGFAAVARADGGGAGSPMAICQDLQDGKLDGTYTQSEWQAFLSDPTVQGYCSVIVPPCVYAGGGSSGGSGGSGGVECTPTTTTTTTATPPPTQAAPPVPLTPQPVAVAAAAVKTRTAPRVAQVKGAQHTVSTRPARSAATAPATAVRRSGTLPFTGMQLSLFLLVGLALVGTGLVLRATGRRRSQT